ncbi:FG-GAP-like repeat-containing protein [Streptomyces yaizuensis]|uniref:VCBS repeat-containing protein n=1 Tax=Streptomyces yaizuensis TaxID=2989713 RepID=A0ABQ5NX10_9ACTN|nr:FG-GAP-like repeat-containing protein [Streptomyces sp. YSPA8]GLF94907.1 VCBS repeat-containing protein [Streptomyces sp. YSPA8]
MTAYRVGRGPVLAAAVTAVLSLAAPPAPATATTATTSDAVPRKAVAKTEDFNGDGYRDVAVAAPGGTVNGKERAGHVAVLYGSKSRPAHERRQLFHQDLPDIPGSADAGDGFGEALVTGDLDRDGYTDLIVSSPGERTGTDEHETGTVMVIWGGKKGLSGSATLKTSPGPYIRAGRHMAIGDFDGDGDQDLAVNEDFGNLLVLSGPFQRDGRASGARLIGGGLFFNRDLAAGDIDRDGRTDIAAIRTYYENPDSRHLAVWKGTPQGPSPTYEVVKKDAKWTLEGGDNLDMGDVNRDGHADVVMGRRDGYDSDRDIPQAKGGMLSYVPGSAKGLVGSKAVRINQDSPGIPGVAVPDDYFGSGVSIADIDGDGYEDVAAGVLAKEVDGVRWAGAVITLRGSAKGLTGSGAKRLTQSSRGVPGVSEAFDVFGENNKLVDMNGDRRADLIVAAVGENQRAGALWAFRGTRSGVTATGSVTFGNGTLGAVAAPRSELGRTFAQ